MTIAVKVIGWTGVIASAALVLYVVWPLMLGVYVFVWWADARHPKSIVLVGGLVVMLLAAIPTNMWWMVRAIGLEI